MSAAALSPVLSGGTQTLGTIPWWCRDQQQGTPGLTDRPSDRFFSGERTGRRESNHLQGIASGPGIRASPPTAPRPARFLSIPGWKGIDLAGDVEEPKHAEGDEAAEGRS
ncbi:hypothetical protein GQ53DRAFT_752341 [Thozetella sp. PMI_491]|nr:hypothetical protein GQ53DRAFT_752341 [Thozetella sp. PMI_491]